MEYIFSNDQDTGDIPSQPANNNFEPVKADDVDRGNVIRDHYFTSESSTFQNYYVKILVLRFVSALILYTIWTSSHIGRHIHRLFDVYLSVSDEI